MNTQNIITSIKDTLSNIFIVPFRTVIDFLTQYIDGVTLVYILFILIGLLIVTIAILRNAEEKRTTVLTKLIGKTQSSDDIIDRIIDVLPYIDKLEKNLEEKLSLIEEEPNERKVTKLILLCALIGVAFGLYLKNPIAMIPLAAIGYYVPIIRIDMKVKKKLSAMDEQIGNMIKAFVTDFTTNRSVTTALHNITKDLRNPLKYEVERLLRKLNSGEPYKDCFMDFAHRLKNKWAFLFAKLVINYIEKGTAFTENLLRVTEEITTEKISAKESSMELTALKFTNIIVNGMIPVVYIANKYLNPEQSRVFTETPSGRMIMLGVIVGSFFSLIIGLKIENV